MWLCNNIRRTYLDQESNVNAVADAAFVVLDLSEVLQEVALLEIKVVWPDGEGHAIVVADGWVVSGLDGPVP